MTEHDDLPLSTALVGITISAVIGAVIGLLVGLVLMVVFDGRWVDNPFWAVSAGIFVGAIAANTRRGR